MIEKNLDSNMEIEENGEGRFLVNQIASSINEVNSNGDGFKKKIRLPQSINGNYYYLLVNNNEVIVEFDNKKGKSEINPIKLADNNNKTIDNVQLYNGKTYLIEKRLINNNQTNTINQSSILIRQVGD